MERYHTILLSTSLRSGRRIDGRGEEVSGALIRGELDLQARAFWATHQRALPPSPHLRGRDSVRGVAPFAGGIAAANSTQVFLLDENLANLQQIHSHPRFGDLHSLAARDGVLYITATASDSIFGIDPNFEPVFTWWAGEEETLQPYLRDWQRELVTTGHDFRRSARPESRFHINHVFFTPEGDLLLNLPGVQSLRGISYVWNATRHRFQFGGRRIPGAVRGRIHDGIVLGDHHYLCRTGTGDFVKLHRETAQVVKAVDCRVPLGQTTGDPVAAECGWLRGAAHLGETPDEELFLVGQSRLTLFLVDMAQGRRWPVTVHDVQMDPTERDDPGLAMYAVERWSGAPAP